jgi:hypothetical protein
MQWVIGGLILAIGVALIIAGAEGSGANLFSAITGKTPATSSTSAASSLQALGAGGSGSVPATTPTPGAVTINPDQDTLV